MGWLRLLRLSAAPALLSALGLCLIAVAAPATAEEDVVLVAPAVVLPDVAEIVRAGAEKDPDDAELAPFLAQFQPLLKTELSFANRVCKLSDEQRIAAIVDGKAWLHQYTREYLKQQQGQQGVGAWMIAGPRAGRGIGADPVGSIEEGVVAAVKKHLTPEQDKVYDAELGKRRDFHRHAAVENLVAIIDEKLYLSADQRQKLSAGLKENWDEAWGVQLEHLIHMSNYLPQVPDQHVVQYLNPEQKTVWQGIQKVHFGRSFGNEFNWTGGQAIDDINLDEDS